MTEIELRRREQRVPRRRRRRVRNVEVPDSGETDDDEDVIVGPGADDGER